MTTAQLVVSVLAVLALLWFLGNALRDVFRDASWNLQRRVDEIPADPDVQRVRAEAEELKKHRK